MTIGPDPITRMWLMSARLGIRRSSARGDAALSLVAPVLAADARAILLLSPSRLSAPLTVLALTLAAILTRCRLPTTLVGSALAPVLAR